MGKLTIIALAWLLLFAIALALINQQLHLSEREQASNGSGDEIPNTGGYQPPGVVLQVEGHFMDDFWGRGTEDLPVLTVSLGYTIENSGNVSANVVTIEVSLDSMYFSSKTFRNLLPESQFIDTISFPVDYDRSETVEIEASCGNATDSWSYTVNATLPRRLAWGVSKLFVTPDELYVEETYREIVSGIMPIHWIALRDWVGRNVEYVSDYDSRSVEEFWQLSKETLVSRKGDCEDFAILLCSLLRADGWGTDEVYVVLGENEAGEYHAWVKIKIPFVGWYNIEPQLNGWNTLIGDSLALGGYTAVYNFNDQYFTELAP